MIDPGVFDINKKPLGTNRHCKSCREGIKPNLRTLHDVKCNKCIGFNRETSKCNSKKPA